MLEAIEEEEGGGVCVLCGVMEGCVGQRIRRRSGGGRGMVIMTVMLGEEMERSTGEERKAAESRDKRR